MARKWWLCGIALFCLVVAFGCGESQQEESAEASESAVGLPATDPMKYAVTLWNKDISWYGTWELMPGTEAMQTSLGNPHGMYGSAYGNTLAVAAATGNAERMPEGSVIVRENYNKEEELLRITAMSKTNGKWFWTVYNPDGTVELAGELEGCIECHKESDHDMLFFWTTNNDDTPE